jgi:hypothetical protein
MLSIDRTLKRRIIWRLVNYELGTNENKAVVVTYELLSWYIPGVTEEYNENILK